MDSYEILLPEGYAGDSVQAFPIHLIASYAGKDFDVCTGRDGYRLKVC